MRRIIITTLAAMTFLWLCSGTALALPEGAVVRLGKGRVNEVIFSPDGEMLAVASSVGVYLYGPFTFKLAEIGFLETDSPVYSISFSPDGELLASGSYDSTVKLWDVSTHQLVDTLSGHSSDVEPISLQGGQQC